MSAQDAQALMKVLAGILEDAVKALQRIEKKVGEQGKIFNELTQKIGNIEKIVSESISIISTKEIPNLQSTLTEKIDNGDQECTISSTKKSHDQESPIHFKRNIKCLT